jgi:membrane protease YdiL (CAAX protease family)
MNGIFHSKPIRWLGVFFLLVTGLGAFFFLLPQLMDLPDSSARLSYNLILAIVLLLLPLAALVVVWALRVWGYREKPWTVLVSAYVLPLLAVLIIHLRLQAADSPLLAGGLSANVFRSTWQPLYYLWQGFVLLFSGWLLFPSQAGKRGMSLRDVARGLLTGLGVGLGAAFFCSIVIHQFRLSGRLLAAPEPPGLLWWAVLGGALTLSPYAVQRFYRIILEPRWGEIWSERTVVLLTAALFALVQARLLLLPAAFAAGLAFSILYRRAGFWAAAAGHAVFNGVLFGVGWYLVS